MISLSLIERWTGRGWAQVASPNPGDARLKGVAAAGKSSAWAVGDYSGPGLRPLIERWDGRAWQVVASPTPAGSRGSNLTAIAAHSPADAWAAGYYWADTKDDPAVRTLIERWNGRAWKQEPSPNPGGPVIHLPDDSQLQAVATVSSSQAWAARSYSSGNPRGKILIERRTGGTWSQVPAGR